MNQEPDQFVLTRPPPSHASLNVALALTGAILLGLLIFLFYQNQQLKQQISTLTTPSSTTQPPASPNTTPTEIDPTLNWKTYRNDNLGISFMYPPDYSTNNPPIGGYYELPNPVIQVGNNQTPPTATQYVIDNAFTISTYTNTAACLVVTGNGNTKNLGQSQIGGVNFNKWLTSGAGLGNSYGNTIYRTVRGHACWEITLTFHTQTGAYAPPTDILDKSQSAATSSLNQILSTFKFIN